MNVSVKPAFVCDRSVAAGHEVATHYHGCHEIVVYGSGCRGETTLDGRTFAFQDGCVSVIPKGVRHSERHASDGRLVFFGFDAPELPAAGVVASQWSLKSLANSVAEEARNQRTQYETMIALKIREFLICLRRNGETDGASAKNLEFCKNYMEENYMQSIRVHDLADLAGYSDDYFRHLFAKRFSLSPQNYLIRVRVERAVSMLQTTDLKCIDIAYLCGFSDSGQMTKMIKRQYGRTPGALRRAAASGSPIGDALR